MPLLSHTLSYTIHLVITYNYRCLLPMIEYLSYFTRYSHILLYCISDDKAWAPANMLKLNANKTEVMLVTSESTKYVHYLPTSIIIGNAQVHSKQSVEYLGFILDCHLNVNAHVSNFARTCYIDLRRLAPIRRFQTSTATATLVSAFVLSRIDIT